MKRILHSLVLLLALVAMSVPGGAQKKAIDSKTHYAREVLQPYVDSGQLPGAISIFYKDGVQETCCIGYADVAAGRRISLKNSYMQCSQTKGFCGVTIAKLVEEGKLSLDDPVSKYLPEFKELWVRVDKNDSVWTMQKARNVLTVRMVMNHTGGFPFEIPTKVKKGWPGLSLRETAREAAANPLLFEPGTKVRYSDTGKTFERIAVFGQLRIDNDTLGSDI